MMNGYSTATKCSIVTVVTLLSISVSARAADPMGLWLTADGEAKVQIYPCGQALCGKLAWLKEPDDPATHQPKRDKFNKDASLRSRPVFGLDIISGMKPSGKPNEWSGSLYNPEDGNTFTGTLTALSPLNMKLQGCVLAIFCRSEVWQRTN
jgi:uncharacterized protein (DUF2147 family)